MRMFTFFLDLCGYRLRQVGFLYYRPLEQKDLHTYSYKALFGIGYKDRSINVYR